MSDDNTIDEPTLSGDRAYLATLSPEQRREVMRNFANAWARLCDRDGWKSLADFLRIVEEDYGSPAD